MKARRTTEKSAVRRMVSRYALRIKGVSDAFFILGSLLEKIVADPFDSVADPFD